MAQAGTKTSQVIALHKAPSAAGVLLHSVVPVPTTTYAAQQPLPCFPCCAGSLWQAMACNVVTLHKATMESCQKSVCLHTHMPFLQLCTTPASLEFIITNTRTHTHTLSLPLTKPLTTPPATWEYAHTTKKTTHAKVFCLHKAASVWCLFGAGGYRQHAYGLTARAQQKRTSSLHDTCALPIL